MPNAHEAMNSANRAVCIIWQQFGKCSQLDGQYTVGRFNTRLAVTYTKDKSPRCYQRERRFIYMHSISERKERTTCRFVVQIFSFSGVIKTMYKTPD